MESNPGPTVEQMFQAILDGQKEIKAEIADLKTRLEGTEETIESFGVRLNALEANVNGTHGKLTTTVETVQVQTQNAKFIDLENYTRRSNLIVFGIAESQGETESDLRRMVIDELFGNKLGVNCCSVARIHRLGRNKDNRPIILYFQDYREKQAIWKNVSKLKGSKISIENDYCAETHRKRKLLWQSAKAEKDAGKEVFLLEDRLRIGTDLFSWNDSSNSRQWLSKLKKHPAKA